MSELQTKIITEAMRIEEDCEHSAKRHFNASFRWERYHMCLGLPSAIVAALSGVSAFNDYSIIAGVLAILSTVLTTALIFLKPSERGEHHKSIGNQYLSLRNKTRLFREIELIDNIHEAQQRIVELSNQRDELNGSAMNTIQSDFEKAKKDIDDGRSQYAIDKENAHVS